MNAPEQHPASNSESRKRGAVHDHAQPDAGDVALAEAMCRTDDTLHHEGATDDFPCWHCIHKAGRLSDWLANHDAEVARTAAKEAGERISPFITISTALDAARPDLAGSELQMWRRVTKVCEESGEVWEALSGYVAENPRKGQTHTLDDLLGELLDTASAALCAWAHLNGNEGDPEAALLAHVAGTADRLAAALEADR